MDSDIPYLPITLGTIIILFVYLSRFNTWVPGEKGPEYGNPPRHYTTWGYFTRSAIFYVGIYEALYFFALTSPELVGRILNLFDPSAASGTGLESSTMPHGKPPVTQVTEAVASPDVPTPDASVAPVSPEGSTNVLLDPGVSGQQGPPGSAQPSPLPAPEPGAALPDPEDPIAASRGEIGGMLGHLPASETPTDGTAEEGGLLRRLKSWLAGYQITDDIALWATIVVTAVIPSMHKSFNLDHFLRVFFHRKALIPSEAEANVERLKYGFDLFLPQPDVESRVIEESSGLLQPAMFEQREDQIEHKWAKCSYLVYQLKRWTCWTRVTQFMEGYRDERDLLIAKKKNLENKIAKYFKLVGMGKSLHEDGSSEAPLHEGDDLIDILRNDINTELDSLLERVYRIVSCGILVTCKVPHQREQSFAHFGIHLNTLPLFPLDKDTLIKVAATVFIVALLPTLVVSFYSTPLEAEAIKEEISQPKRFLDALVWPVLTMLLQGSAILVAIIINRYWLRSMEKENAQYDKSYYLKPSLLRRVVCAIAGYISGLLILLIISSSFVELERWSSYGVIYWPLLSAVTAYFVAYYLGAAQLRKLVRQSGYKSTLFRFGLVQGVVSCAFGVIAVLLYLDRWETSPSENVFILYISIITFATGFAIGYMFPEGYLKLEKQNNRRAHERKNVTLKANISMSGKPYPCIVKNLSEEGAFVGGGVKMPSGNESLVRLTSELFGEIIGRIVDWSKEGAHIQFFHDKNSRKKINEFLEQVA